MKLTRVRVLSAFVLVALALNARAAGPVAPLVQLSGNGSQEPGTPSPLSAVLTNTGAEPLKATLEYSIQRDSMLTPVTLPDPVYGSDHALGCLNWTDVEGKVIDKGSLTDNNDTTSAATPWATDHFTEAFQYIDLGQLRKITHMAYRSGDAGWIWKLQISASEDGKTYTAVAGLQDLNLNQKWGAQAIDVPTPFSARYLKLRYHTDGKKQSIIRMPAGFSVFDGVADEKTEIPQLGPEVIKGHLDVQLAPGEVRKVDISQGQSLATGAYAVLAKLGTCVAYGNHFVMPPVIDKLSPDSPFGVNVGSTTFAKQNRRLGVSWVRMENWAWDIFNPMPDYFAFDGSVEPWKFNQDAYVQVMRDSGFQVLPYVMRTPKWASSGVDKQPDRPGAYPPNNPADFAKAMFQLVARFGHAKHPADVLGTTDKKSGLGLMNVYELWNEPDLHDPGWGGWVGEDEQYYEMFRLGAEAVKKADPTARVSHAGMAGFDAVYKLAEYKYADGKRPIDFADVINFHYYTGRTAPESASINTNVDRSQDQTNKTQGPTYADGCRKLAQWRDKVKPGTQIWLTETGYDTGGPWGVSERRQAAWIPRMLMISLANGIDKVFLYRESGDVGSLFAASGVIRNDGSLKPSWFTYATLIRMLEGASEGRRIVQADPNIQVYTWKRDGKALVAVWTIDGQAKLPLHLGHCKVTDAFGYSQTIEVNKDLAIGMFPQYLTEIELAEGVPQPVK